jgi:hypothetical protein
MIGWILIIAAILGIVFIAQLSHFKHKFSVIFLVLFLLFLVFSFLAVANSNSLHLGSATGFFSGIKLYFSWLGHAFDNMRVITGNVVRMDWFTNSTG